MVDAQCNPNIIRNQLKMRSLTKTNIMADMEMFSSYVTFISMLRSLQFWCFVTVCCLPYWKVFNQECRLKKKLL